MLLSLLSANIRILSCIFFVVVVFFFLFLVILNNFLIIPVIIEKIKLRLAFAIAAGASTTFANEMIQIPLLAALKIVKVFSM